MTDRFDKLTTSKMPTHEQIKEKCHRCKGTGFIIFEQHVTNKTFHAQKERCISCHGTGKVPKGETKYPVSPSAINGEVREQLMTILSRIVVEAIKYSDVAHTLDMNPYINTVLNSPVLAEHFRKGWVQIADDQSLPDNPAWHKNEREYEAFCAGRNILIQGDSTGVWRKVKGSRI